jgi:hypothetical protein
MNEPELPPEPDPMAFSETCYHWGKALGKACPTCQEAIRWAHDGYLYHGRCSAQCQMSHISTKERIWPA